MRKITAILLLITIILPFPIYASKIETKKGALEKVKTSIEESKKELDKKAKEIEVAQNEARELDRKIIEVENRLLEIDEQLGVKEEELTLSEEALKEAKKAKEEQYENGKKRIESMYKNQKVGYIQIIFTSKNFWEMLNRMEYIRKIAEYDHSMLEGMKEKQEEVAVRTEQLEAEKEGIALLYKEQVGVKSRLDITREEKDRILQKLEADGESLETEIEGMIETSSKLEKEVQQLIRESELKKARERELSKAKEVKFSGGRFLWPVPGHTRISSQYGTRIHPISGQRKVHTGIDIAAPYGASVVAVADGKVISAGWMGGYGYMVMIDHGSGLVSLYAHNSSNTVSKGQKVSKGDRIAKIGSTGYSTGNHSHFEVRLNGGHVNPFNYIK